MSEMRKLIFHITLLCVIAADFIALAQNDSIHLLQSVDVVQQKKIIISNGFNIYNPDSTFTKNNIGLSQAEFLFKSNIAYVKSYGPGNISSISIRGGSAQQTQVNWNGMSVNNAMLGQSDLSLFTLLPNQNISIVRNSSSSALGSGAVAGTILIEQALDFNKGIHGNALYSYGTTNNQRYQLSANVSKKKFVMDFNFIKNESFNLFNYQNSSNNIILSNYNAFSNQQGIAINLKYKLNEKSTLIIHSWYQNAKRFLPDYIVPSRKESVQNDESLRFSAQIIRQFKKTQLRFQQGLLNDEIVYQNPLIKLESNSQVQTWVSQIDLPFTVQSAHNFQIGISNYYSRAFANSLTTNAIQNRSAIIINYSTFKFGRYLQPNLNIRQEIINTGELPFSGTLGLNSYLNKTISLYAHLARLYRVPTINDLYWSTGGNEKLLSEKGYSAEGGLSIKHKENILSIELNSCLYFRDVNNWIGWQPGPNGIWRAVNFGSVKTQGTETELKFGLILKKLSFTFQSFFQYNLSVNAIKRSENDESHMRQILYSPLYSASCRATLQFHGLQFVYGHNYTGYRYTSTDNYQYLNPFDYAYIESSFSLFYKDIYETRMFLHINNLYNENYQLVKNYPQAQRNYRIGIMFNF